MKRVEGRGRGKNAPARLRWKARGVGGPPFSRNCKVRTRCFTCDSSEPPRNGGYEEELRESDRRGTRAAAAAAATTVAGEWSARDIRVCTETVLNHSLAYSRTRMCVCTVTPHASREPRRPTGKEGGWWSNLNRDLACDSRFFASLCAPFFSDCASLRRLVFHRTEK